MTRVTHIQFHVGDFLSGVMHMDGAEIGAYTMLLMAHYQLGVSGIPDDEKRLIQITKTSTKVWRRIKGTVLGKFTLKDGFWTHKRVIEEIEKIKERAGPGRPKDRHLKPRREPQNDLRKCEEGAQLKNKPLNLKETEKTNHKPITNNQKKKINKKEFEKEFEEFWGACPRKVGKGKAREKYFLARESVDHQKIISAVRRHAIEVRGKDKEFIPHPATWLHQERYYDELSVSETEPIENWPKWKKALAARIGDNSVKSWFAGVFLDGDTITVPRPFQADKIRNEFLGDLSTVMGVKVQLKVRGEANDGS